MKRLSAALFFLVALNACAMQGEEPLSQTEEQKVLSPKISLDVKSITLTDRSSGQPMAPFYDSEDFSPSLPEAIKQWAVDHLQARGRSGQAIIVIKKASFVSQPIPTEEGIESWFVRQQASKYVARVDVSIEASGPNGFAVTDASAYRTVTLPENPTSLERKTAYQAMLDGVMQDLGDNLDAGIHKHMVNFLVASPVVGATAVPMSRSTTISETPSGLMPPQAPSETLFVDEEEVSIER
ncbi:MAG: hypothetical protein PHS57_05400 [Alphaproteobacteria bacterium]|nr:hypothetical protein [Alphaproteobacteria bacterium]